MYGESAGSPADPPSARRSPAVNTPVRWVRAPDWWASAERVNEPEHGYPENSPAAMLASPWPKNSWLLSRRSPVRRATVWEAATASMSPSAVTAIVPTITARTSCRSGSIPVVTQVGGGSVRGTAPTTGTPRSASPRSPTARPAAPKRNGRSGSSPLNLILTTKASGSGPICCCVGSLPPAISCALPEAQITSSTSAGNTLPGYISSATSTWSPGSIHWVAFCNTFATR